MVTFHRKTHWLKVARGSLDPNNDVNTACASVVIAVFTNLQISRFRGNRRRLKESVAVDIKDLTRIDGLPDATNRDLGIAGRDIQRPIKAVLNGPSHARTWRKGLGLPDHVVGKGAGTVDDRLGNTIAEAIR